LLIFSTTGALTGGSIALAAAAKVNVCSGAFADTVRDSGTLVAGEVGFGDSATVTVRDSTATGFAEEGDMALGETTFVAAATTFGESGAWVFGDSDGVTTVTFEGSRSAFTEAEGVLGDSAGDLSLEEEGIFTVRPDAERFEEATMLGAVGLEEKEVIIGGGCMRAGELGDGEGTSDVTLTGGAAVDVGAVCTGWVLDGLAKVG